MNKIRYSPSKLKTFKSCKLQYKLNYLDKIVLPQPYSPETVFGTMIHKLAEIYNGANKSELVKLVKNYKLNQEFREAIAPTLKNFFLFWEKYKDYPAETEKGYELKNDDYWLYGIVDRRITKANNEIIVVDYKTAKNENRDGHLFQMQIYNLMLSKLTGKEPAEIKCLIYYPRIHVEDKYLFSNKEIADFEQEIKSLITTIETNTDWEPTASYACKWCAYKEKHCPIKGKCHE
jgi:RecB family exonuclease